MILFAIAYGLLTFIELWAAAGADPAGLAARAPLSAGLHLLVVLAVFKWQSRGALTWRPFKLYDDNRQLALVSAFYLFTHAAFALLKTYCPEYLTLQTQSLAGLNGAATVAFLLSLGFSDLMYRSFFATAWGPASAAFLEALTWGLATQSFVGFVWIFATGYLSSRVARVDFNRGYLLSALLRMALGLVWINRL